MTTLSWIIERLLVKPTEGSLTDVVITADWRCNGVDQDGVRRGAGATDGDRFARPHLQVRRSDAAACHPQDRVFGVAAVCHRGAVVLLDVTGEGRALALHKFKKTTVGADADDHADFGGADRVATFDQPRFAAVFVDGERHAAAAIGGGSVSSHGWPPVRRSGSPRGR